jgi:hypothetical protein
VLFGIPTLSADKLKVTIPFTGKANPILTADLSVYEYSLTNGATWIEMTAGSGSDLTSLDFTGSGASFTFVWEADSDIGPRLYNNYIRLRLKAESGLYETAVATYILYLEKVIINPTATAQAVPFPQDYRGIPGSSLLENAPKG